MLTEQHSKLVEFIWSIAERLRGPYRPPQYRKVMLPLIVLHSAFASFSARRMVKTLARQNLQLKRLGRIDPLTKDLVKQMKAIATLMGMTIDPLPA